MIECPTCYGKGKIRSSPQGHGYLAREKRIEWLIAHKTAWGLLWKGWKDRRNKPIFLAMQNEGLYSLGSSWRDCNISSLITVAKQRIMKSRGYPE